MLSMLSLLVSCGVSLSNIHLRCHPVTGESVEYSTSSYTTHRYSHKNLAGAEKVGEDVE
ncbi:hypothetical protein PISMIDRAFT_675944 [Pisolithus microcarpus 441]|uniref:Uncharacterized protein n=1 Tax=Pisolithus microcarpus 441 TaxID=765257 RepID=A0A0C9ZBG1_9AGAM|nr:hypothetical protein PISMIDRAFT_675944 [Pisolithus microcarpus 441]